MTPATAPVRTIGDLPFVERPVLELLGFEAERETVDLDYAGFGWARVERLWLATRDGAAAPRRIDRPLVLALHSADDGEALPDDVELEFVLDDRSVTARLSAFLARWLPRLPAPGPIVLAMCNPHGAVLPPIAAAGGRDVHCAMGPVDAWLHDDDLHLVADAWREAGARDREEEKP